jgi:hypothetical protein
VLFRVAMADEAVDIAAELFSPDSALVQRFQGSNHMKPLCRTCRTMSGPLVALGVVHLGHDAMLAVSWNR